VKLGAIRVALKVEQGIVERKSDMVMLAREWATVTSWRIPPQSKNRQTWANEQMTQTQEMVEADHKKTTHDESGR